MTDNRLIKILRVENFQLTVIHYSFRKTRYKEPNKCFLIA